MNEREIEKNVAETLLMDDDRVFDVETWGDEGRRFAYVYVVSKHHVIGRYFFEVVSCGLRRINYKIAEF